MRCHAWHADGDFFVTTTSCMSCIEQLGPDNKEAIRGCGMGLDAANLLLPRN